MKENTKLPEIIIVDDHESYRGVLKTFIEAEKLGRIVGEASDGHELIQLLTSKRPDLVLLDIDMPGLNGIMTTIKAKKIILVGESKVLL